MEGSGAWADLELDPLLARIVQSSMDMLICDAGSLFLTDILRHEWGFKGYVVSDSGAVEFVHTKHRVAPTYEEAVRQSVEAGLNIRTNFSFPPEYVEPLRRAETIVTEPGAHTCAFHPGRRLLGVLLPQTHRMALYADGR